MSCSALMIRNPRGFMRLFILFSPPSTLPTDPTPHPHSPSHSSENRSAAAGRSSVLILGWTHNAAAQKKLKVLILTLATSQLSFLAGTRVNLQQNSSRDTVREARSAFALLPSLLLFCPPATNQRGSLGDQGRRAPTSWLLSSSKVPL